MCASPRVSFSSGYHRRFFSVNGSGEEILSLGLFPIGDKKASLTGIDSPAREVCKLRDPAGSDITALRSVQVILFARGGEKSSPFPAFFLLGFMV
jgi:hypothetical protein